MRSEQPLDQEPDPIHGLEPYAFTDESNNCLWRPSHAKRVREKYSFPFVVPVLAHRLSAPKVIAWVPVRLKVEVFEAPAPVGSDFRWRVTAIGLDAETLTPLVVMRRKEVVGKGFTFARKALQGGGRAGRLMYDDMRTTGVPMSALVRKNYKLVNPPGEEEDDAAQE